MIGFLKYLMGGGVDDVTMYDQTTAEEYLHHLDPTQPDDLAIAAVNRGNRTQFISLMADRGVWVIVRLDQGEFVGDIRLLEYEEGDRNVLPIFSSLFEAMAFVYTIDLGEMVPLQYMRVPCSVLTHNDLSQHKVVMNPYAGASTEITDPDIQALRTLLSDH